MSEEEVTSVNTNDAAGFDKDLVEEKGEGAQKPETSGLYSRVQEMSVAEKIKLATLGNKQAREVLIKDSNKLVAIAVIKNPRIGEDEILKVINSRNISDEILRIIANNKEWTRNYSIKLGLVENPKTPLGIALKLLGHLVEKDLQKLSKSKNVSNVLATTARKMVTQKGRH